MKKFLFGSYRRQLFAAMLAASLIPLFICTALTVQITRLQMESKVREDAAEQSAAVSQSMDAISDALNTAANQLRFQPDIRDALLFGQTDNLAVNNLLFQATENARSFAVFELYDNDGICRYSTQGTPTEAVMPTLWGALHGADAAGCQPVFYAPETVSVSTSATLLTGAVRLQDNTNADFGYLVMRINAAGFRTLLDGKYPQSEILLLSRFFRPVYSSQGQLMLSLAPELRQQLLSGQTPEEDEYIYTVTPHEGTGMFLVLRQRQMFTRSTLWLLYSAGLICALVCVGISVLVTLPLSRQISLPIRRLQEGFAQVQQDDLETRVDVNRHDELGKLAQRFNEMVTALKTNRAELLRNQQELKEAQLRMLQAQLNPHFLCNTLDTMKWISKMERVPQVALMSTNLADILRFCISAQEFVPLYREIEILERYIEIQKIRLSDDFSFTIHVPEELYDCMVPKMILQPIVENAILHGLGSMEGSAIALTARYDGGAYFQITVTDNGKGFPPEMVGRPYRRDKTLAKGHLGLYNVDTILTKFYGEECGLYLDRGENGIGAAVTATLPIHYEEEETEC